MLPRKNSDSSIWVFGYGSLIWVPNFAYEERIVGYIDGFKRRFWQGSMHHRGTSDRPGRVVTLVKSENNRVWGVAYRIQGQDNISKAVGHLTNREISLGGYEVQVIKCHTLHWESGAVGDVFALVYYAAPENQSYRGGASYDEISTDILLSYGYCGSNIEYLFRLADFMRKEVGNAKDEHLYSIDHLVRLKLGLCTKEIRTWLELIQCSTFLGKLEKLVTDINTNGIKASVYFTTRIASQ